MRFGAYVDGFNLYYSLRRQGWRRTYWLDLQSLCAALLPESASLEFVNFYTSRSHEKSPPTGVQLRQQLYWRALRTRPLVNIIEGKMALRDSQCEAQCRQIFTRYQEKETDVKLGIDLVRDAIRGLVDGVLVLTGDTDQVPTLKLLREETPALKILPVFPPSKRKFPAELTAFKPFRILSEGILLRHQLPESLMDQAGLIARPLKWK